MPVVGVHPSLKIVLSSPKELHPCTKIVVRDERICTDTSYSISTGIIKSQDLGFNDEEQFTVQRNMTCTPLNFEPRTRIARDHKLDDVWANYTVNLLEYNFGPLADTDQELSEGLALGSGITEVYNPVSSIANYGYTVSGHYFAGPGKSTWAPIEPLRVDNSAISLIGISSNTLAYFNQQVDPIFLAEFQVDDQSLGSAVYQGTWFRTFIGCAEQVQFCNPRTKKCSGFVMDSSSPEILSTGAKGLGWTEEQLAMLRAYVLSSTSFHPITKLVSARGGSGLLASNVLNQRFSADLDSNQWMLELRNMFQVSLTATKEKPSRLPNRNRSRVYQRSDQKHWCE